MSTLFRCISLFIITLLYLSISACADNSTTSERPRVNLSAALQDSYDRSCKTCHEVEATASPQTGDIEAWGSILEHGLEQAVERAVNGYKGMPPGGQCFECTPEQLGTLILYMAQTKE